MPKGFKSTSPWSSKAPDFYHVSFRIHRGEPLGKVEIRSAFHLPRRPPRLIGESSDVAVELLHRGGRVLDGGRRLPPDGKLEEKAPLVGFRGVFSPAAGLPWLRVVR